MLNLQIPDELVDAIVNGLDCLVRHKDDYGYKLEDVAKFAALGAEIQKSRSALVDNTVDVNRVDEGIEPDDEGNCPPGYHFVLGQGCIKNKSRTIGSNKS